MIALLAALAWADGASATSTWVLTATVGPVCEWEPAPPGPPVCVLHHPDPARPDLGCRVDTEAGSCTLVDPESESEPEPPSEDP